MIIDLFIDIANGVLLWLMTLRPTWEMPYLTEIRNMLKVCMDLNHMLPFSEALIAGSLFATFIMAVNLWKWSVKLVDWIMDIIP